MSIFLHVPARNLLFTGIDFEGSGASKDFPDDPIQIGLASMLGGQIDPLTSSYLNPGHGVTPFAYNVHKIGAQKVEGAPHLRMFYPQISGLALSSVFVAHSGGTEKRHLKASFPMLGTICWVDTLKVARYIYPANPSHDLTACVALTGREDEIRRLVPGRDWHDALFDAVSSLVFLNHCLSLPGWEDVTISQLQNLPQTAWKQTRARPGYVRRNGQIYAQ